MREATRLERTRQLGIGAIFSFATLFFSNQAYAYINPGTGSILLQILLGGMAGLAIITKIYWAGIKNFLRRKVDRRTRKA